MTAWIIQNCERTFRLKANSQSSSVASSMLPLCTKPAQLKTMSMRGEAGHLGGNRRFVEHVQHGGVHIRHAFIRS